MSKGKGLPLAALLVAVIALAAGVGAFISMRFLGSPAPLGVPLPAVPSLYTIIPRDDIEQTSVLQGRMPEVLLEMYAAQPDGAPPLRHSISCDMADFRIAHTYGTTSVLMSPEEVNQTGTLMKAELMYDQPIKKIIYQAPIRQPGESVTTFVSRVRHDLERKGARFYQPTEPVIMDGYRLEHLEFDLELDDGTVISHFQYFGPFGEARILLLDFMTSPDLHEAARPLVNKIISSFTPGWRIKLDAQKYDASYVGPLEGESTAAPESPDEDQAAQ